MLNEDLKTLSKDQKIAMLAGVKVIVADDNSLNRIALRAVLQRWGMVVDFAANGQEVIDILDSAAHKLVFMDLNMPIVDGYMAIRKIRNRGMDLPIIALTASISKTIIDRAMLFGASKVLHKPTDPTILLDMLCTYLLA